MAATSFSKPHFGLGLAHTPLPPNTVVGEPQLSLVNTPHAQMVAQQQTKLLRNHVTCQQVLSLLPAPQGYWFFPRVGHSGRLKGWHRVTCHWHPERHTLECQPEGEEIEEIEEIEGTLQYVEEGGRLCVCHSSTVALSCDSHVTILASHMTILAGHVTILLGHVLLLK